MDLAALYLEGHQRIVELLAEPGISSCPVPACPGWSVHDVVAHLVSIPADVRAGRLVGPPTDEQTAEQVARNRDRSIGDLLDEWSASAGEFAAMVGEMAIWPAVIDITSHEHDIRGAIGRAGARDSDGVRACAGAALKVWDPGVAVEVRLGDDAFVCPGGKQRAELALTTDHFEVLRFRLGRRSRAQMAAMNWDGDPTPVLDRMVVMGPASADIIE